MPDDVIFEDLPSKHLLLWQEPLKARPGEWARLPLAGTNSTTYNIRFVGFEFVSRTVDGKSVLYGRYVGQNGSIPT